MCDEIDEQHELLMRAIDESRGWNDAEQAQYGDNLFESWWDASSFHWKYS